MVKGIIKMVYVIMAVIVLIPMAALVYAIITDPVLWK